MPLSRRVATLAVPVLTATVLFGCGAGSPPTDADPEAFCEANSRLTAWIVENSSEGQPPPADETYDELQASVDEQEEVGTPEDMPDDARAAWEDQLEQARDVDEDELAEALESGDPSAVQEEPEGEELDQLNALTSYTNDTCPNPLGDLELPQ